MVDSGLRRESRYDADTGLPRLVTVPCSRDSAIQRAGRAGRTQEGCCIRLYSEGEFKSSKFPMHAVPELLSCDLVPTILLLAEWGYSSIEDIRMELPFVDTPPVDALQKATQMLIDLEALEGNEESLSESSSLTNAPWPAEKRFKMTFHGQKLVRMPTHPRLATCIARAKEAVDSRGPSMLVAAVIASALLDDEFSGMMQRQRNDADLSLRVRTLLEGGERTNSANVLIKYASRIGKLEQDKIIEAFHNKISHQDVLDSLGDALLPGFIDLVAKYKSEASYGGSTYMLSLGRSARLDGVVDVGDFIVVLDTSTGDDGKTRIRSYVKTSQDSLLQVAVETDDIFTVPSRGHEVRARRLLKVGSLELSSTPLPSPSTEAVTRVLMETIEKLGGVNAALVQTQSKKKKQAIDDLRERVGLAIKMTSPEEWPECFEQLDNDDSKNGTVDEDILMSLVEPWLAVASSLKSLDMHEILRASLSTDQLSRLSAEFPTQIEAPDGTKIPVRYSGGIPMTSAKLQQFFGATESPSIGPQYNTMPISISLLSPSGKPLAQTLDLPFFWNEVYPSVRSEMRGRYPKHPWPEDPMNAIPTRLSKKQQIHLTGSEKKTDPRKLKSKQRKRK